MSEKDTFGKLISLLGTISNDLNSEQFYDKLYHDDVNLSKYYSECTPLITPYKGTIEYVRLRRTCAQLVKYLKTTYTTLKKEELKYDHCILLNYWIYSRIVNILGTDDGSVIAPTLGNLELIWNTIVDSPLYNSPYKKCIPDGNIATQKDWKKRKELYDYCVNYEDLKKILVYFEKKCEEYWTYVESHTSLYKYFEKLCSESSDQCPQFYENCKKYDPKYVLRTFKCHEDMEKKKAEEIAAKARQELQASISADQQRNSRITGISEFSSGGLQSPHNGTHPVTQTGNILLGVVATSLTSGALYRFTPLGNMLRNGFGWNNNNIRNMHGDEYGLFDYTSESFNPYTGGVEEHHIGYQPA